MSQIRPIVPSAPIIMPGKKPAAKERPSKDWPFCASVATGQLDVCELDAGFVADGDEPTLDVGADGVTVESLEHIPLLHVYPSGQHFSPHFGSWILSVSERCIWLSGCKVAFSWLTSQVMVWMNAQSEPEGQHMTDCIDGLLSDMHVVSFGQQNEEGKPVPHCWRLAMPPHVESCLANIAVACTVAAMVSR